MAPVGIKYEEEEEQEEETPPVVPAAFGTIVAVAVVDDGDANSWTWVFSANRTRKSLLPGGEPGAFNDGLCGEPLPPPQSPPDVGGAR